MAPKKIQTIFKIFVKLIVFASIFKTATLFLSSSISQPEKTFIYGCWLVGFILCFVFALYASTFSKRFGGHAFVLAVYLISFGENVMFIAKYKANEQITHEFLAWTILCACVTVICLHYFFPIINWLKLKQRNNSEEQFA